MPIYGYARVSTDGQTLDAQIDELKAAGTGQIFREKASGARADRPELACLLRTLDEGDVVLVTRLDRLARSTRDLLNVLAAIAECGASFRSLGDAWADTTTPHGRLMLTVLGGLAEFERELIRARTGEGRKRAQAQGVRFGRKPKLTAHQRREALERREAGEPVTAIARSYAVHHSMISRLQRHVPSVVVAAAVMAVAMVVMAPGPAKAAPSDCYSIRDQSERQACIAYQSGEPAMCVGVQRSDARALCHIRAEERRKEMGR